MNIKRKKPQEREVFVKREEYSAVKGGNPRAAVRGGLGGEGRMTYGCLRHKTMGKSGKR